MTHKTMLVSLVLLITCLPLVGCGGTPVPPVDTATNLAKLAEKDMTLNQVYDLMSDELKATITTYPALGIEQTADGGWEFTGKGGGLAEDEEAPFHVLVFTPDPVGADHYMVFFENESVIGDEWFSYSSASIIERTLVGTLIED